MKFLLKKVEKVEKNKHPLQIPAALKSDGWAAMFPS